MTILLPRARHVSRPLRPTPCRKSPRWAGLPTSVDPRPALEDRTWVRRQTHHGGSSSPVRRGVAFATVLGASTMKEAVNRSLEADVLAARRRRHADRLDEMSTLDLAKPRVMSGAWR